MFVIFTAACPSAARKPVPARRGRRRHPPGRLACPCPALLCGRTSRMRSTEQHRPGMMTRLASAMHGEVSADTVEAYRRAGGVAYQDMTDAEQPGCHRSVRSREPLEA